MHRLMAMHGPIWGLGKSFWCMSESIPSADLVSVMCWYT